MKNFSGFYMNLQNTWKQRLLRKPNMISHKYSGYGYGKTTEPFYIDYGNKSSKIDNVSYTDSRYMYGSSSGIKYDYVSDITTSGEGGTDSGF